MSTTGTPFPARSEDTFRTTVTLPKIIADQLEPFLRDHGFRSLSDYLTANLRRDMAMDPRHSLGELAPREELEATPLENAA